MPIERTTPLPNGQSVEPVEPFEIEIVEDEEDSDLPAVLVEMAAMVDHHSNLAEAIEETELGRMGSQLVEHFKNDKLTRKDWEETYTKGLDLLGLKNEERTDPWDGACGAFHPMLTEAVVGYQSQTITDMFPASGPVRHKTVGKWETEKSKQGSRVENEMNYQLTENMDEYRAEMEFLLFRQPLAGSAFKKVNFDEDLGRAVSIFVPAEDFVIRYGASSLRTCSRYTHVQKLEPNEVRKRQVSGFYRDIELPDPAPEFDNVGDKTDEMSQSRPVIEEDDRHTILEMHVELDLPEPFNDPDGIKRPYVVTIDKSSLEVLSIYRNWREGDTTFGKKIYFVHYPFIPGMGFYGIGLIHLIGGLTKASTSILRQLVDAGTLSNLPGGLKTKGLRMKGDDTPVSPGEWRDVDVPGGAIKDNIFPMPYGEPSQTLFNLLIKLVEWGRRVGSIADLDISSMSQEAPVGTTLALLERSMKVVSAVLARNYAAFKEEVKLVSEIIAVHMPEEYDYEVDGPYTRAEDFDGRVDVIPVMDPNASTMAQRVVQYQAALQLAEQAPEIYDKTLLHRQMIEAMNIPNPDKIIPMPDEMVPMDPVTENMRILKQEPIKAFYYQDHEAHIKVHMAAAQDPKINELVGQSPNAARIQGAMADHVTEHIAFQYRKEIEQNLGAPLPEMDVPLPQDVEHELSKSVADAATQLLEKNTAEMAAEELKREKEDPLTQIQHRELQVKEQLAAHQVDIENKELDLKQQDMLLDAEIKMAEMKGKQNTEGAKMGAEAIQKAEDRKSKERVEGAKLGADVTSKAEDRKVKREEVKKKETKKE